MIFLPTTTFRVLEPTDDFPYDFQVIRATDYVVHILNSNNVTYVLSGLVLEQRLRQGRIQVLAFPAHPSHCLDDTAHGGRQCQQCMQCDNEEGIQFACPLPSLGTTLTAAHPYRSGVHEMPGGNTICPACVLTDARIRLCPTHVNCPTCGNPRAILCPTCLTEL